MGYALYVPVWISKLVVSCIEEEAMSLSVFHCYIPLSPNSDQHQFSPNDIHTYQGKWLWELIKCSPKRKYLDLLSNSLNLFLKEMYGDQLGEIVCGYWGLKGYLHFSLLLSQFQPIFSTHLCHLSPFLLPLCGCFKVMLSVKIYPNRASLVVVTDIFTTCAEVITFWHSSRCFYFCQWE